jgi:Domain of unknown function (DUF222)
MGFDPRDDSSHDDDSYEGDEWFDGYAVGGNGAGSPGGSGSDPADETPVAVPDELDHMPPGPWLAEMLHETPVEAVSGYDSVVVLAAAYRQLCHQQAVFYRALVETGLRADKSASTVARLSAPGEFAAEEARAKLVWSWQRSGREYQLGFDLMVRFPDLGEALHAGHIDLPRARAFVEWTDGLTDAQATTVINHLLPDAGSMVVGELIDKIKRAAIAIDSRWPERRYQKAVKTRRVRGYRNPDGTANVGGYSQPVDRVVAACARIDQLARACKAAGDRRRLDLIRSDLYLRMLDGSFEAMTDKQIIAHVLAHPLDDLTGVPDDTDSDNGVGNPGAGSDCGDRQTPGDRSGDGNDPDGGESGDGGDPGRPGGPRNEPDSGGPQGPGAGGAGGAGGPGGEPGAGSPRDEPDTGRSDTGRSGAGVSDSHGSDDVSDASSCAPGAPVSGAGYAVPELRMQLITLLGRGDEPGELPGWDFVPAGLSRRLAETMGSAEWRWVICDRQGRPVDAGLTSSRPNRTLGANGTARVRRNPRCGGVLELAVAEADLHRLAGDPDRCGAWAPVIADIHNQYLDRGSGDSGGRLSTRSGADQGDAGRRLPGARLRRWIEIRDRVCQHPCCRASARSSEVDHRIGWAVGGATVAENLGSICGRDHRIKDEGGWQLHRPQLDMSVWISPLGHSAVRRIPPVIPPPVPLHRRDDNLPTDTETDTGTGVPLDPCSCLLRPCPHDDGRQPGEAEQLKSTETPHLDEVRRTVHAREAFYEDEPPF